MTMPRMGWVLLASLSGLAAYPASPQASAPPLSCAAAAYRQFDFWIGDWDVFDAGAPATPVARVRVDRILDGCVLREDYQAADGKKGQSFNIYDASRKVWHQSWVTNRGESLELDGGIHDGKMVLSGEDLTAGGQERLVRGVWVPGGGGVRETAVTSTDGGKTWKPWFDLLFRPGKL
jgi:hypothetical protein